jgi:hypothetical protein
MCAMSRHILLSVLLCLFLSISAVVGGQVPATLSGPVAGYVLGAGERNLRPLRGILGSATIGDPIEIGLPLSQAWSLDTQHILASPAEGPELVVIYLEATSPAIVSVSGVPANPSEAAISASGSTAAFYYGGLEQALIVTGLPSQPVLSGRVDMGPDSRLSHMAISDDGTLLVFSAGDGAQDSLFAWTPGSTYSRFLAAAADIGALALTRSGTAVVADRDKNEILLVRDVRTTGSRQTIADVHDGVMEPVAITVSSRDDIYVANAGSAAVLVFGTDGQLMRTLGCACTPSGLYRVRESVFRLSDAMDRTIYLLDVAAGAGRIVFVPPLPSQ